MATKRTPKVDQRELRVFLDSARNRIGELALASAVKDPRAVKLGRQIAQQRVVAARERKKLEALTKQLTERHGLAVGDVEDGEDPILKSTSYRGFDHGHAIKQFDRLRDQLRVYLLQGKIAEAHGVIGGIQSLVRSSE